MRAPHVLDVLSEANKPRPPVWAAERQGEDRSWLENGVRRRVNVVWAPVEWNANDKGRISVARSLPRLFAHPVADHHADQDGEDNRYLLRGFAFVTTRPRPMRQPAQQCFAEAHW
jgi:hypothetical protein